MAWNNSRRVAKDSTGYVGITTRFSQIINDLCKNLVYAHHPNLPLQDWLDLITHAEDREFLKKAQKLTDNMGGSSSLSWRQPLGDKMRKIDLDFKYTKHIPEKKLVQLSETTNPDLCRQLVELQTAATEWGVVQGALKELFDGHARPIPGGTSQFAAKPCVTTLAQLAKAWPKGIEIVMPEMEAAQRAVLREAQRSAKSARVELSAEMQRALSFVEFHVARCSLVDPGWPDNKTPEVRVKLDFPGTKENNKWPPDFFRMFIDEKFKIIVRPQYPY